jgi:D-aspartate ligase
VKQSLDTRAPALVLKLVPNLFEHGGLGALRTLGRMGVTAFGVHDGRLAPAALSRYERRTFTWNARETAPAKQVEFVLDVGRQLGGPAVLIAQDDVSMRFVADHATRLRRSFVFPEQTAELVHALSNKKDLHFLCKEHGVPTPDVFVPASADELHEFARDRAVFPVVVKGATSWIAGTVISASVDIVRNEAALFELYEAMTPAARSNLMLQEYIPGGPETVWMFNGYFDRDSNCLFGATGRKLRQFPPYTGMTSLGLCTHNETVKETTTTFMKKLGYRGILDLGYRYDARDGQYKLLDVNPRMGATFRLFTSGDHLDVVRVMYLDLTGQHVAPSEPREGRRWVVENWDLISSFRYGRDGSLTWRDWLHSYRGVEEGAWFARDDPLPAVAMLAHLGPTAVSRLRTRLRRRRDGAA